MLLSLEKFSKIYPLGVLPTTILLAAMVSQPSSAFTINPAPPMGATNKYEPGPKEYQVDSTKFIVELDPKFVTPLPRGGTQGFVDTLSKRFPTWSFSSATKDLDGSFDILNYVACEPATMCKSNLGRTQTGGVGAYIDIKYQAALQPGSDDPPYGSPPPSDAKNGIHWIQRVIANYNPFNDSGDLVDLIDVDLTQTNPYYDDGGTSDMSQGLFADRPYTPDKQKSNFFKAELYLVNQTAPNTATIYNGVQWGWRNYCKQTAAGDGNCKDWGDAPDSYGTTLARNGPRYGEGELQRLGQLWDKELDGQPTAQANGDDIGPPFDDEDGVIFGDSWVDVLFNIVRPGENLYNLSAWWDCNKNGRFEHGGTATGSCPNPEGFELVIDDNRLLSPGIFTQRYNLGFDPRKYYSRFRLTCDPVGDVTPVGEVFSKAPCNTLDPVGQSISHGEVEDYAPVPEPSSILGLLAFGGLGLTGLRKKRQ